MVDKDSPKFQPGFRSGLPEMEPPVLADKRRTRCGLCYGGDRVDVVLNNGVLALLLVALSLSSAFQPDESLESRLFFLPFGICCFSVQGCVNTLVDAEGFSLVWSALLGLLTHAHLEFAVHRLQPAPPHLASGISAGTAAAAGVIAIVYYGVSTHPLSTVAHLLATACGFGAGAMEHGSAAGANVAIGCVTLFALVAITLPMVLKAWGRRGVDSASSTEHRAHQLQTSPSSDYTVLEMALASLQAQLLRTRDESSQLQHKLRTTSGDGERELKEQLELLRRREEDLMQRAANKQREATGGALTLVVATGAPAVEGPPTCRSVCASALRLPTPRRDGACQEHNRVRTAVRI